MKDPWKTYKSMCCKAPLVRVSRANYRCSKCNTDETMGYLFYAQMQEESDKLKQLKKDENNITTVSI
jgi:hypothetical protein